MKPRTGRIVGLFVVAFVAMVAPVAAVFVLGLFGPPPYVLHADQLGPEWLQATPFPDGSVVQVHTYPSASAAIDGANALADSIPSSSITKTLNVIRFTRKNGDHWHGMLLPVENRVIQIDAAAYNYQYNLAEMKNPLIEAIVGSGWTFAPVTMFFRPLGG